jgi:hypothetical protein
MVISSFSTAGAATMAERRTRDVAQARHKALPTKKRTTTVMART